MLPNPVEVADHQSSCYFRLFPDLTKLVLPSMPFSRLLPNNAIGAFESLCIVFANVLLEFRGENSLIPTPTPVIAVEILAISLPSVLNTNCSIRSSVCLPTRAVRIKPLELTRLRPIQQSPTSRSWVEHCFCFLKQMTTVHRRSLLRFARLVLLHYEMRCAF